MSEQITNDIYIRIKNKDGDDFVCPIGSVNDIKVVTDDELDDCVDTDTVQRYSGNITIAD